MCSCPFGFWARFGKLPSPPESFCGVDGYYLLPPTQTHSRCEDGITTVFQLLWYWYSQNDPTYFHYLWIVRRIFPHHAQHVYISAMQIELRKRWQPTKNTSALPSFRKAAGFQSQRLRRLLNRSSPFHEDFSTPQKAITRIFSGFQKRPSWCGKPMISCPGARE